MISRYLVFPMAGLLFGVKLRGAIEILAWRRSRFVPLSYHYVEGLIDHRGTLYPVFNLMQLLGLSKQGPIGFTAKEQEKTGAGQSIILLEQNKMPFGIIAQGVARMTELEEATKAPDKLREIDPTCISGVAYEDDQEIIILNFERLLHAD